MERTDESVFRATIATLGLADLCAGLDALAQGDSLLPIHVVAHATEGETGFLAEALHRIAGEKGFAFFRLGGRTEHQAARDLTDEFEEKLFSPVLHSRDATARARNLLAALEASLRFSSDQTPILYAKGILLRYQAYLDLIQVITEARPLMVLVEEAGELPAEFQNLLLHLGRSIVHRQQDLKPGVTWPRVVFVLTGVAPDPEGSRHPLRDAPFVGRWTVHPWTEQGIRDLAGALAPKKSIAGDVMADLLSLQGAPFLIGEIMARCLRNGSGWKNLLRSGGTPRDAADRVLRSRLAELTDAESDVLRVLAVAAAPLAVQVLKKVADVRPAALERAVQGLADNHLVALYGPPGQQKVEIVAGAVAKAVLGMLSDGEGTIIHQQLAAHLGRAPSTLAEASEHSLAAGNRAEALGSALRALDYARGDAANRRRERLLNYLLAVFHDELAPPDLLSLRRELAEILALRGAHREALPLLKENWRTSHEQGDAVQAARTRVRLGILKANLGETDEALRELSEACDVLDRASGEAEESLRARLAIARVHLERNEYHQALKAAQGALALIAGRSSSDLTWRHLEAAVQSRLGSVYAALSEFKRAEQAFTASYKAFGGFPDSLEKGGLCCNLANLYTTTGDYTKAWEYYQRGARVAEKIGAKELLSLIEANLGVLCIYRWDLAEAEGHILTARYLSEEIGSHRFARFARLCHATLRARQARYAEALRLFAEEHETAVKERDRYFEMNLCFQSVPPHLELGHVNQARRAAEEGSRIAEQLSWPRGILEGAVAQAQVAVASGLWDEAEKHVARAREAPWGHHGQTDADLTYLTGEILAGKGEIDAARWAFRAASSSFRKLKSRIHALRSDVKEAALHLNAGRLRSAAHVLDAVWSCIAGTPPAERPPQVWLPALIARVELLLREGPSGKAAGKKAFYETAEAIARAREIGAAPLLWQLLALAGMLTKRLGQKERAAAFFHEAAGELDRLVSLLPKECKPFVLESIEARRLSELVAAPLTPSKRAPEIEEAPHGEAAPGQPVAAARPIAGRGRTAGRPPLPAAPAPAQDFCGLIGESAPMRTVFALIEKIAPTDLPILITGASGTGKELVARAIHSLSRRSQGPFAGENCAAIPPSLAESELFGYVRGAFTGAEKNRPGVIRAASGGTLFLDEVGDLPLALQAKLLRVLEEGEVRPLGDVESLPVDVRLVTATCRDLRGDCARGAFREDLFYRLLGVEIRLPSLRDRGDDILLLFERFLRANMPPGKPVPRVTAKAKQALLAYGWPGNVRELENEARRLTVLGNGVIDEPDLRLAPLAAESTLLAPGAVHRHSLAEAQALLVKEYIEQALRECGGCVVRAAKLLGINRRSIYKIMGRMGSNRTRFVRTTAP
jgi:two-component system, repressor protein LuxO